MLADVQVQAFHERRVDLPAMYRSHLIDALSRAEHDTVHDADETPPAHGLDHLHLEQPRPGHPAGLRVWPCGLTACGLPPVPLVG